MGIIKDGIFKRNATFVLALGMCPTLSVTTSVENAIGMGLSATAVLICSNAVISIMRRLIPQEIRIASYIVIIAGFVSIVDMILNAFAPELYAQLGIFIPLITVNCIILARAEEFASKNSPWKSVLDGIGTGIGFTLALMIIASVREILGQGQLFGISLFGESFQPAAIMLMAPGGFLVFGIIMAIVNVITHKRRVVQK